MIVRTACAVAAASLLVTCPPASAAAAAPPPTTGRFDYQLGGPSDSPGLAVVVRDATASPLAGAYNVCYVNGFQTQPGSGRQWLDHHGGAVLRDAAGAPVVDPDWPDEYVLDPSTPERRAIILDVLAPVVIGCARSGFDAVEIDNLDTFTRQDRIDAAGAIELARSYARLAHDNGLAIGQKNAAEIAGDGLAIGFDFAVAEECAAFDECDAFTSAYGRHVLQVEYTDNLPAPFADVCAATDRAPLTILRDRGLVPAGAPGHVFEQCA